VFKSRKGINTFRGFQEGRQVARENIIDEYLNSLRRKKTPVKFVTQLAEMVAEHVTECEKGNAVSPCNASTLLRNQRYKMRLLEYMAEQPLASGYRAVQAKRGDVDVVLIQAQLDIVNLTNENARLKRYIANLEDPAFKRVAPLNAQSASGSDSENNSVSVDQDRLGFLQTCRCLFKLLRRFSDYAVLEPGTGEIVDPAVRRGDARTIVSADDTAAYRAWLKENSFIEKM
jgi:hypothetical protein